MNHTTQKHFFIHNRRGMTLPELMIAVGILAFSITGILMSYLRCMELNEISQSTSTAIKAAESRLELIRNTADVLFSSVKAAFHQMAFDINGLDGKGVSYVDDTDPNLLLVNVCVSWRQKNGRVHGQDTNLNGQKDAGEDPDGNNMLDSSAQLTTYIFKK